MNYRLWTSDQHMRSLSNSQNQEVKFGNGLSYREIILFPISTTLSFAGIGILVPKDKWSYLGLSDHLGFLMLLSQKSQKEFYIMFGKIAPHRGRKNCVWKLQSSMGVSHTSMCKTCGKPHPTKSNTPGIQTLLGMKAWVVLPVKKLCHLSCYLTMKETSNRWWKRKL